MIFIKRKETICLQNTLIEETKLKRIYGCEEVTIGFYNQGKGNEIVDFMTMDSKGTIKCYEIKVTLQDLKSKAKKSFYGHYNYLVVTSDLYNKVTNWDDYIDKHVGIIMAYPPSYSSFACKKKAKKCNISLEDNMMLKESLIRSMYWKMSKYFDAQNIEKQKKLEQNIRRLEKENRDIYHQMQEYSQIINEYETYKSFNDNVDIDLKQLAKQEKEKFRASKKKV